MIVIDARGNTVEQVVVRKNKLPLFTHVAMKLSLTANGGIVKIISTEVSKAA